MYGQETWVVCVIFDGLKKNDLIDNTIKNELNSINH